MTLRTARRLATTVVAIGTAVAVTAGPASAHECFNTQRSAQADSVIAQHSHGWFDIQTWQLLGIFLGTPCDPSSGPCPPLPADVQPLIDAQTSGDLSPDAVIGALLGFADPSQVFTPDQLDAFDALVALAQTTAADAACLGVPTHYLTLSNATAAGGAVHSPNNITADGKGIDHFPDLYGAQLFQAYGTVFETGTTSDCAS
jgi:hypothetical protein